MEKKEITLHDLVSCRDPEQGFGETRLLACQIASDFDSAMLEQTFADITRLFQGQFPGYRASNTRYHDLEHTCMVTLALARLLHGRWVSGFQFSGREVLIGLLAALFHDTGLIQRQDDLAGTGAKYTIGHEERSIALAHWYLARRGFSSQDLDDITQIIHCTILSLPTSQVVFRTPAIETVGKALGSADILAQMADRAYLEKLPKLFTEFVEGGLPGYGSGLTLLKKTEEFYHAVAQRRLTQELGNEASYARPHFQARWQVDRDLYAEAITRNIDYLQHLRGQCGNTYACYLERLQRRGRDKKRATSDGCREETRNNAWRE